MSFDRFRYRSASDVRWNFQSCMEFPRFTTVTHAADASEWLRSLAKSAACGRRAADMRPTLRLTCGRRAADLRPTRGRRNATDYERHNAFPVLSQMRPTLNRPLRVYVLCTVHTYGLLCRV